MPIKCRIQNEFSSSANDDKIAFVRLGVSLKPTLGSQKVDPQTIFFNQEGMYDLVMSSRKPEAKVFRRWISHEVLPSINQFGSYSIEKKYGCFYDDHDLYEYDGCNVCYMAYLGVHDGLPLFKYGITFDYYRREYQEHRKTFDLFQLVYLRQTDYNHMIDGLFTKDVYVQKEFKRKNRTELFTTTYKLFPDFIPISIRIGMMNANVGNMKTLQLKRISKVEGGETSPQVL